MNEISIRQIKEPDFSAGFSIRNVGTLLSDKDLVQELHRHSFFFALFLEKGHGEHHIDFTNYPVNDYSVFFMRPGQVHQLTLKQGCKGYLVQFNHDFYAPKGAPVNFVLRKVSNKNHCPLSVEKFGKLLSQLSLIDEEYSQKQDHYKEVIKAGLEILFIELARQSREPKEITNEGNMYSQNQLEELLELLQNHIVTHKQVIQYAEMMHLTTFQLNKITKETVGKTCSQLINEQIVLEAKRHLLATGNQVNQIAFDLGFEDPSYFARFFKKHSNYSPEAFRKNCK
ncbi:MULTISPECIES: helix-turn-helix domain-containing protein [unclassified Pedobacter]|uniref:helix-turn-helix domain-containing protein n=1 Tax=unclassified Pedobacter TaxID=2628915 RepID=UPI001D5530CC|nr:MULTISPECIES: helix-turn-helix domain-containing protein [unclassified Pedobacter]CAH0157290.1 HTH-type transcriptional regulator ChbR [Pedobacter sp. Bi36]CAH0213735.1 HTH-type transcriptional regulator ChbR [Pedobacter sp. Bi126]